MIVKCLIILIIRILKKYKITMLHWIFIGFLISQISNEISLFLMLIGYYFSNNLI